MDPLSDMQSAIKDYLHGEVISFGNIGNKIVESVEFITKGNLIWRIRAKDETLWAVDDAGKREVSKRLNWLDVTKGNDQLIEDSRKLLHECLQEGFTHALLVGMGGSSLAPEVYQNILREYDKTQTQKALSLSILDTTDPDQILSVVSRAQAKNTLFIISSKSGTTAEVDSIFSFLWEKCQTEIPTNPGGHFIAITDPGTVLEKIGKEKRFRKIFTADPNVGGRFSALIAFGLVPAILCGFEPFELLRDAQAQADYCFNSDLSQNPAASLAAFITGAYSAGLNKLTLIGDSSTTSLGSWLEQLIAESSGKDGKGILPVNGEPFLDDVANYSIDRIFVYLRHSGENAEKVQAIAASGFPVLVMEIKKPKNLGGFFYVWEFAVALTCALIGINAFNQPDVQSAKDATNRNLQYFRTNKTLPELQPSCEIGDFRIYSHRLNIENIKSSIELEEIFSGAITNSAYIALNAFIERNQENESLLQNLRRKLLNRTGTPITCGFGPRYLHSTGQLHKGGKDDGIFLILSVDEGTALAIPNWDMSFKILHTAQTIGDYEALKDNNRRVLWVRCRSKKSMIALIEQQHLS